MRGARPCWRASAGGHAGDRRDRRDRSCRAAPAPGKVRGAAPAAGHRPRTGGRSRATWQGSRLESPVCFLPLQVIQCFISLEMRLENIHKCLALAGLERGHGVCFGVVGRVLCFELIIAKFVAQKKFM